jgi:phytol kinase
MLLMVSALLAAACIAGILFLSESLWKRFKLPEEVARKIVHISAGSFIAFLPFWVDYTWIKFLAIGFILVNVVNHFTNTFQSIRSVRRKSIGDILLGAGVFIVALFEPPAWLFAISILQVSLADGLAAVVGVSYKKKTGTYYLFGQPKTFAGSITFLLTSMLIMIISLQVVAYFADPLSLWPVVIMLPLLLMCAENLAVYGTDNLVLPLMTLYVLSLL